VFEDHLQRIDAAANTAPLESYRDALHAGQALHRQLRPKLSDDYVGQLEAMFGEGARLTQLVDGGEVRALALWRAFHTTYAGYRLEIDDLVTDEAARSRGYGATLLAWLEGHGRTFGCDVLTLNSATHRGDAHRFYFRQGYKIAAFHFGKDLRLPAPAPATAEPPSPHP
jgi:GNAT superfamily N-acetyltransferase